MSDLDDLTTEVPSSSIELEKTTSEKISITDINKQIQEMYKLADPEVSKAYKKGATIKLGLDTEPDIVLRHVIQLYIDTIREKINDMPNDEERTRLQQRVKKIHNVLNCSLDLLRSEDFKLDINSVVHIIHGYVNNNVEKLFEDYETRRRITH